MSPRLRPISEAELQQPGRDLRVRDVIGISGLSRGTILNEVERGRLYGHRLINHRGSPWMFTRAEVSRWMATWARRAAC